MSRRITAKNLVTLVVLLILAGVPTASLANFHSLGNHSLNPALVIQPSTGTNTQLGFDCGLGTTAAVVNGTGFPVAPSENGPLQILPSCTWIGDVALTPVGTGVGDGTNEPLVTDQDETFGAVSPAIGGGFTADMVYLQNATSATNGFDMMINWNPTVLQLVKFDQGGLPWLLDSPFTQQITVDNSVGSLHVVQVIFVHQGGDLVFFRLRFDVVGVGNTGLLISNDLITNPGAVVHTTNNGAFDAESFFDPTLSLNWVASFTNSTPIIPGSTNSFQATVTGGTGPYTYAWDLNSDGITDSTANPASLIIPTATLTGNRIMLTVTDSAVHVIAMVHRLPLTVNVQGPQGKTTTNVGTVNTFTGDWLGGIPPYTGSWRFCPGALPTLASVDCTTPAPSIVSQPGQTNTRSVTYSRAGVYTNTLKITDSATPVLPGSSPTSLTFTYMVNVTGTPQAYTLTLSANPTTTTVGQIVQYSVVAAYSTGYTLSLRSSTISVKFAFGDGTTATSVISMVTGGANTTSVSHTYLSANASPGFTVLAVGQETAANAVSLIQEVSNRVTEIINARSTSTVVSCSPGSVPIGTPSTCTATVTDSSPGTGTTPKGTVDFASDGAGTFISPSCNLVEVNPGAPACSVVYTPTAAGSGTHTLTGTYSGDSVHATSQGSGTVLVSGGAPTVTVNSPTPNPASTGQIVTVTFSVSSTTTVTGITVAWGDGTTNTLAGTATSDTHTYASTGTLKSQIFTITVTATNSAGPGSSTTTETVNDRPPTATVSSVLPNPANTGQLVTITFATADPDGTISSITVSWGDGTAVDTLSGTATSDTHTYNTAGPFTITVTATDNSGSTGPGTGSITVNAITIPTVTVNAPTPNPANTGQLVTVTFTVTSSVTVTGITVNWGDGTTNTLSGSTTSDTHTYSSTGALKSQTFTITATATNSAGPGSGTTTETVNDRIPVVTGTSVAPNPVNTGTQVTVSFTATDPDGTVSSITVNWGDSSPVDTLSGTATSDTHTYTSAGSFTITITATDNSANTGQGTTSITVNAIGVPTVTVNPPTPNPANTGQLVTVTFTVTSSVTVTGITVNWGDGTINTLVGTATSDTHTYLSTGALKSQTFTITVTATNSAGPGSGTTTEVVNDLPPVVTISSVAPTSPCVGQSVTVSFTSTDPDGTVASNVVSWGDGTAVDNLPGTATSDTHTYTVGGAFAFSVTATDNSGSTGQGTGSITTVLAGCVPTVTVNTPTPNPVSTGQLVTVTFTVTSTSTVNGITVNWGDGTTNTLLGTVTMDSHTYASTGNVKSATFTITVTATNSAGPGSGTTTEVVNDLPPAVTVSNVSPNPANTGQLVTVTFAGTDPDGTVSSITVSWGDGSAVDTLGGGATSDTHTYTTASTFTITLTATDNSGSTGQATGSVTTVVPVGAPTVTVNNPTPNPADTGATVTVVFTVSSTAPVTVVSVDWGDGTTNSLSGSATSDTHSYSSTGTAKSQTFTITVTATNSAGPGSGSTTETVNDRPPVASFTFTPINPSGGQAVNFDATASTDPDGTITSYAWDFGDGTSGTGATQIHIYNPASTMSFTVMLTVTDNSGNTGSTSQPVTVTVTAVSPPTVSITNVSPNPASTGQMVSLTFTVSSTATVTGITVSWGDGTTLDSLPGSATSDTHSYANTGNAMIQAFTITVTATNSGGPGSATTTETVNDRAPVVTISTVSPNPANTGQLVTAAFTATDPDGTVSSIIVNWGDSTTPDSLAGSATSDTHTYASTASFTITITATDNSGSTGSATTSETVTPVTTTPVNLTFQVFNFTAFHDGFGSFEVLVNGHVVDVVNIPFVRSATIPNADSAPGANKFVNFGPFDITAFVVQGQNNITFVNPTSSRFSLIRNVMITQGNTIFLNVMGARFVSPGRPVTFTFSNPPLTIRSFTASNNNPFVKQDVTFTATYTGGTGPFKCLFRFGNGNLWGVKGNNGSCSVAPDYDFPGSFTATVRITGSTTGDDQRMTLAASVDVEPDPVFTTTSQDIASQSETANNLQSFSLTVTNPSSKTILLRVDVLVTRPDGSHTWLIGQSFTLQPGQTTTFSLQAYPPAGQHGTYEFKAALKFGIDNNSDGILQNSEKIVTSGYLFGSFTVQ